MIAFMVTDGETDVYGTFTTRELAQAYIDQQKAGGYPFWRSLTIEEWPMNEGTNLCTLVKSAPTPTEDK